MAELQGCIYGRKSREGAAALESQIAACMEWAERNGIEVVEIFEEEGSASSEDWNRPELQKMLKKIANNEFHYVIVSEQTRISRTNDFYKFTELMDETETLFASADTNEIIDYANASQSMLSGVKQAVGGYELKTAKTRLKRGTVQAAKKGHYQGKKPPLGYTYDRDKKILVPNDDAPVMRRMFELYLSGKSTTEISHIFTVEGVKAYHKKKGEKVACTWTKSTVARSLKNIVYAGHTVFGKTKLKKLNGEKYKVPVDEEEQIFVENTHEAIVTPEEFEQVQKMIAKKRFTPPALKHAKHKFSGLIACAECGKHHTFEFQQDAKREKRISACNTRIYNEECTEYKMCKNSGCKLSIFEELFYGLLEKYEVQLEYYIELIKESKISQNELERTKESYKKSQMARIEKLKNKRKNILDNLEDGVYEDDEKDEKRHQTKLLLEEIKELQVQLESMDAEEENSEANQVEIVLDLIKKVISGKNNPKMDEKEQNEILSEFIEDIYYRKSGRWAEVEIQVLWKSNVKDLLENLQETLQDEIA